MREQVYVKFAEALRATQVAKQAEKAEQTKQAEAQIHNALEVWQIEKTAEIDAEIHRLELEKQAMKTNSIRFLRAALKAGRHAAKTTGATGNGGIIKSVLNAKQLAAGGPSAQALLGNAAENFPAVTSGSALAKFISRLSSNPSFGSAGAAAKAKQLAAGIGNGSVPPPNFTYPVGALGGGASIPPPKKGHLGKILAALGVGGAGAAGVATANALHKTPPAAPALGGSPADKKLLAALGATGLAGLGAGAYAMSGSDDEEKKSKA